MRRLSLVALLSLPTAAVADTYLDKYTASAELVSLAGVKEVPLYRAVSGGGVSSMPLVMVEVGEGRKALFALTLADDEITISEDLAKELKLKVKNTNRKLVNIQGKDAASKHGDERKQTRLASLKLGELELADTTVSVREKITGPKGYKVEGIIGLAALPEQLAWAVLPSQGIVRIGPAASGADLVSGLAGDVQEYRHVASYREKTKIRKIKSDVFHEPEHFLVHGVVGATAGDVALGGAFAECTVAEGLVPADALRRGKGDATYAWLPVTMGSTVTPSTWFRVLSPAGLVSPADADAVLCADVMAGFDVAIDPVNHKVSLRAVQQEGSATIGAVLLEEAKKAPPPPAADEKAEEKKDEAGAEPKKDAGPNKKQAGIQAAMGDLDGAIANWTTATELEPRDCANWTALGGVLLDADRGADAIAALEKASTLYHGWWDIDHEERAKIVKANKKLEPADLEKAEKIEQASSCSAADGQLARARLASGQLEDVGALYRERLDLDPVLAIVAGNAALSLGEPAAALEPYRQAILRETVDKPGDLARLGVALAERGDWSRAEPMFLRAMAIDPYNPMTVSLWGEALFAAKGPEQAQAAAADWARANPDSVSAQLNWVALSNGADRAAAMAAAETALKPHYGPERVADQLALHARLYVYAGDLDKAAAKAAEAIKADPSTPYPWLVAAQVADARGDTATAATHRAKAARLGAANPAYASLARP